MESNDEIDYTLIADQLSDNENNKDKKRSSKQTKEDNTEDKKENKSTLKKAKKKRKKSVDKKEKERLDQSTEEASVIVEEKEEKQAKPKKKKKGKETKDNVTPVQPKHEEEEEAPVKEEPSTTKAKASKGKKKKKTADPIKDKSKDKNSVGGDDNKKIVFEYMKQQNRPYSVINIFDNLHGSIKKAQLQKILDALTEEGLLVMKEYNTRIYIANQNLFESVSDERMKELENEENETMETIASLKETLATKQNELKTILTSYTDEELQNRIIQKKKLIKELSVRAEQIKRNEIKPIATEVMIEAEKKLEANKLKYKKTKRICLAIADNLAEGMEMKQATFMDELGLEYDTDILAQYKITI